MDNILHKIVANKKQEVAIQKQQVSIDELEEQIQNVKAVDSFRQSLEDSPTGIISEFKRKSPSRGWIFRDAKIESVIPLYERNGAAAISVLTDTEFFGGTFEDFRKAAELTETPLLRKDFMVDEYQIYQAKAMGASAVLLIASALTVSETFRFAEKATELHLDVLLEIHNEKELDHINAYIDVVGVNNRNLNTFVTDVQISFDLSDKIPSDFLKISESGISRPETVIELRQAGFKGFLMGENFMKTENPGKALEEFIEKLI